MNAPAKIKPTLEQIARELVAGNYDLLPEGDYTAYTDEQWQSEAQAYLDCVNDGYDDKETRAELIRMIAEGIAQVHYDSAAWRHDEFRTRRNDYDFTPFNEWFDGGYYTARAAESYVPAIGGAA